MPPLIATDPLNAERRFGRPPGVNSEDTRRRLLDAAKIIFAERGYKDASNKLIANAAAMTTGAIYHYFPTKQALFLAIHIELQAAQLGRLEPVVERAATLHEALAQLLAVIAEQRANDPHSTGFFSVVRMEAKRNPEISAALDDHRWLNLFERLAALGVRTGEVSPQHARSLRAVMSVCLLGIAQHAAEATAAAHRSAVEGFALLIKGELMTEPVKA